MTMNLSRTVVWSAAIAAVVATSACKGDSPSNPSAAPCATITIANNAVNPKTVTVAPGCQVTFMNNDTVGHNMQSDPHPEHTDCPAVNSVGTLNPGQSRQTGNLNAVRSCGFHDHDMDGVAGLRGTITVR